MDSVKHAALNECQLVTFVAPYVAGCSSSLCAVCTRRWILSIGTNTLSQATLKSDTQKSCMGQERVFTVIFMWHPSMSE